MPLLVGLQEEHTSHVQATRPEKMEMELVLSI